MTIIEISDEQDALLTELCLLLGMGRGRVIGMSLEHVAGLIAEGDKQGKDVVGLAAQIRDSRSVPEIGKDELELAQMRNG